MKVEAFLLSYLYVYRAVARARPASAVEFARQANRSRGALAKWSHLAGSFAAAAPGARRGVRAMMGTGEEPATTAGRVRAALEAVSWSRCMPSLLPVASF